MTPTLTRLEADVQSYLNCTSAQAVALCDDFEAYGINTFEDFEDAFFYQTESWRPDEEFAEFLFTELNENELDPIIEGCIDWQTVWDSAYRFDFWSVCIDETTYYFHNCY